MTFREHYEKENQNLTRNTMDEETKEAYVQNLEAIKELSEEELRLKQEEIEVKKAEVKARRFDSILRIGGIVLGGVLTIAQIVTVGLLEKDQILQNHPMQFVDKRSGK